MASFNKTTIVGYLGQDANVSRTNGTGTMKMTFSVGVSKKVKDNSKTNWFNVVVWGKFAESLERIGMRKGMLVLVNGEIDFRRYEKDGRTIYITELVADSIQILSSKNSSVNGDDYSEPMNPNEIDYEGLPF